MSVALAVDTLTRGEARALTEEVKRDGAVLRAKLLRLYEGRAHEALGYSSWGDYYTAEFGQTAARGYQLLDAARVSAPIQQLLNEPPPNEAQARELVPLKDDHEAIVAAWREAGEIAADQGRDGPTAPIVREAVAIVRNGGATNALHVEGKRKVFDEPASCCPTCARRLSSNRPLAKKVQLRAVAAMPDKLLVEALRARGHEAEAASIEARVGPHGWVARDEEESA